MGDLAQSWALFDLTLPGPAQIRLATNHTSLELAFQPAQSGDLCTDGFDLAFQHLLYACTVWTLGISQGQEIANFIERKPEFLGAADELEIRHIGWRKQPETSAAPRRPGKQPLPFIKTDGVRAQARFAGHFADLQEGSH